MKKLKLNLDEIKVESFETGLLKSKQGTVFGQLPEQPNTEVVNCTAIFCNGGGGSGAFTCDYNGQLCYTPVHPCLDTAAQCTNYSDCNQYGCTGPGSAFGGSCFTDDYCCFSSLECSDFGC